MLCLIITEGQVPADFKEAVICQDVVGSLQHLHALFALEQGDALVKAEPFLSTLNSTTAGIQASLVNTNSLRSRRAKLATEVGAKITDRSLDLVSDMNTVSAIDFLKSLDVPRNKYYEDTIRPGLVATRRVLSSSYVEKNEGYKLGSEPNIYKWGNPMLGTNAHTRDLDFPKLGAAKALLAEDMGTPRALVFPEFSQNKKMSPQPSPFQPDFHQNPQPEQVEDPAVTVDTTYREEHTTKVKTPKDDIFLGSSSPHLKYRLCADHIVTCPSRAQDRTRLH